MSNNKSKSLRRKEVWKKTNGLCAHCGRKVSERYKTIDHFIPKIEGGTNDMKNLIPLCKHCNTSKAFNIINPIDYYIYLPEKYINDCLSYKRRFNSFQNDLYLNYILEEGDYESIK